MNLQSLIENYNTELNNLENQVQLHKKSLLPEKVKEFETKSKNELREKYLAGINSLILLNPEDLTKKLIAKKYPNMFSDNKLAGEIQVNSAQKTIETGDENKIMQELEMSLNIQRYDYCSYILDSILSDNEGTQLGFKLRPFNERLNKALDLQGTIQDIKNAKRENRIAEFFKKDVEEGRTAVFPFTSDVIKAMPLNVVSAQLDRVTRSVEINGSEE